MRTMAGAGLAAGAAALPFGAAAGWLRWRGYYTPDARTAWMLFWLCGALLAAVLLACVPENDREAPDRWRCSSCRTVPLWGLGPSLAGSGLLCLAGALGELSLQLPPVGAALWSGGTVAALVWLALCLLALVCRWSGG